MIFFYFHSTKNLGVSKGGGFFSCKNIKTPAIFGYLISSCHIQEDLVIRVEKILVASKNAMSGNKSWAKNKKFIVEGE